MSICEYLVAEHRFTTNQAVIAKWHREHPVGGKPTQFGWVEKPPEQKWTGAFHIWKPGASRSTERSDDNLSLSALFNEFGREGWILMDATVLESIVATEPSEGGRFGWHGEVGMPIRQRWTFMRVVES